MSWQMMTVGYLVMKMRNIPELRRCYNNWADGGVASHSGVEPSLCCGAPWPPPKSSLRRILPMCLNSQGGLLYKLAEIVQAQGRLAEADALFRRALAILYRSHGDENP